MREPGMRVGAILSADEKTVKLLGYGVYLGDEVPPASVDEFLSRFGMTNPKIALDNGNTVWGCQCWWASEEKVREMIGGREIVDVRIPEEGAAR